MKEIEITFEEEYGEIITTKKRVKNDEKTTFKKSFFHSLIGICVLCVW
jgi:hypothetical protein